MNQPFVDPYKQIWENRDLRSLKQPLELDNKLPQWRRGLGAFGDEMQATGHGLVALGAQGLQNAVGENDFLTGVRDWGLEGYQRNIEESHSGLNAPSVARVEDIKSAADFGSWTGYQLGKGLPMLGSLALSGGAGGAVGRTLANKGVKELAERGLANEAKEMAAKSLATGATVGGVAGSFGLEGGLAYGEQVADGADPARAVASGVGVGAINAALEFLPLYAVAKKIGVGDFAKKGIYDSFFKDKKLGEAAIELARRVTGAGAVGAATEGVTEGLQELVNIAGQRWANEEAVFAPLSDEDKSQLLNAAAAGGLVGGTFAGGVGGFVGPKATAEQDTPPAAPTESQPASTETERRIAQLQDFRSQAEQAMPAARAANDVEQLQNLQQTIDAVDSGLERLQSSMQQELPLDTPAQPKELVTPEASSIEAEQTEEQPSLAQQLTLDLEGITQQQEETKSVVDAINARQTPVVQQPPLTQQPPVVQQPVEQPLVQQPAVQQPLVQPVEQPLVQQPLEQPLVQQPLEQPVEQLPVVQQPVEQSLTPQQPPAVEPPDPKVIELQKIEDDYNNGMITITEKKVNQAKVTGNYNGLEFAEVDGKVNFIKKDIDGNVEAKIEHSPDFDYWLVHEGNAVTEAYATLDEAAVALTGVITPQPAQPFTDINGLSPEVKHTLPDGWLYNTEPVHGDKVLDSETLVNAFALGNEQHLQDQAAVFTELYGPAETLGVMNLYLNSKIENEGGAPLTTTEIAQKLNLPDIEGKILDGWDVHYSPNGELIVEQKTPDGTKHFVTHLPTGEYAAVTIPEGDDPVTTLAPTFEEAQTIAETNIANALSAAQQPPTVSTPSNPAQNPAINTAGNAAAPDQATTVPNTTNNVELHNTTNLAAKIASDYTNYSGHDLDAMWGDGASFFMLVKGQQAYVDLYKDMPTNWRLEAVEATDSGAVNANWVNWPAGTQKIEHEGSYYTAKQDGDVIATESTMADALAAFGQYSAAPTSVPTPAPTPAAPTTMPAGYTSEGSGEIKTFEGKNILFYNPSNSPDLASKLAHVHNYIHTADIPVEEKIKLLNYVHGSHAQLNAYLQQHPFLLRKVSIAEAQNEQEAVQLLHDIVSRRDKYKFEEIITETGKFADTYGEAALAMALASAPTPQGRVPSLQGWLEGLVTANGMEGIRSEQDLANENPHDGIWAEYPTRSSTTLVTGTGNVHPARYGVVVINPKDGKVLLRKVKNQYEGITWDFARGGADYKNQDGTDTFGGLTAKRIDRGPDPNPNAINPNRKRWFEHPLLAAKREAKEEFGLDVQVIGQLAKGFYDGDRGMASLYYVAVPTGVQDHNTYLNPTHGVQETDETRWVDLHEARKLVRTLPTVETGPQFAAHEFFKHDDHYLPRLNRIARTLEAVYDPNMQKSDFAYRAPAAAMEKFFKGAMKDSFPDLYQTLQNKPSVADMSELQKIKVASALYVESRYKTTDTSTKKTLANQEARRREASLKAWMKDRLGLDKLPGLNMIVNASANISTIKDRVVAGNGKIVLSMWHGTKGSRELMVGDKINPFMLSSGWGGSDTNHGMFFTDTQAKAYQWGGLAQVNVLVAFDNLKIVENEAQYNTTDVDDEIALAKQQGYDGIYYNKMIDSYDGRQIIVWNSNNMIAGGGQGVNHTGQNLYQTRGELGQPLDTGTARVLLDETLGERTTNRLLNEGILELVESGGPDGVAGHFHAAEGKIKLYLNYITSPRELLGALFHEGSHAGMRYMLGDSVERYHKELLEGGGEAIKLVMFKTAMEGAQRFGIEHTIGVGNDAEIARVRAELVKLNPNFLLEEDLANFVQQGRHSNPGLWRKIVNAIKVWWATSSVGKFLKERGIGLELTDDMAVALVTAALRNAAMHQGKDYSTYVAHTTGSSWPSAGAKYPHGKPDLKYVLKGNGEGYISYGWGFYALESQATLDYYKQGVGAETYGFHVPDDITSRLIEWDRPIGQQHPSVQQGILDPRDNYLLLRMATRARNRVSSYPSGPKLKDFNTGSGLYSELRDYFWRKEYNAITTYKEANGSYTVRYWDNGEKESAGLTKEAAAAFMQQRLPQLSSSAAQQGVNDAKQGTPHSTELEGYMHDSETDKTQRKKNLARRWASRKMAEYGIAGVHLLDAGSREIQITRKADGSFRVQQGIGHTLSIKNLSIVELEKHVGPELASKAQQQTVGEPQDHTGFGFYNWVFWRQSDLDRLKIVYKKGNQVAPLPNQNTHYDTNGIGEPFAEHPGISDWVINPKTGEQLYHSQTERTLPVEVDELRESVASIMGEGWLTGAEKVGLVEVVDGAGPNGESGSWDGKKIRLYAGSMPVSGSAVGVLLHEGKHATFEQILGVALPSFVADLKTMAAAGNQAARQAITQAMLGTAKTLGIAHNLNEPGATLADREALEAAIEERAPGLLAEESLAYFVQNAADGTGGGLFRRLLNALKAWFSQTALGQALKDNGIGFELTEGMAVEWAKLGLHKTLNKLRMEEQVRREVMNKASTMQASELLGAALQSVADTELNDNILARNEEYMQAIKNEDWTTARQLVDEAAQASDATVFNAPDTTAYSVRRKPAPVKTVKRYKAFRMRDGKLYPLYVGATDALPIGTWLDAKDGGFHFEGHPKEGLFKNPETGKFERRTYIPQYVTGGTGTSVPVASLPEHTQKLLRDRGYKNLRITLLAYRPGWHTGTLPYNPQGAGKRDKLYKKKTATAEHPYQHILDPDVVIAEVELAADNEAWETTFKDTAVYTEKGEISLNHSGVREIPVDGYYDYTTQVNNRELPGDWSIGGSLKINRLITPQEADQVMRDKGYFAQLRHGELLDAPQLKEAQKAGDTSSHKLLDLITYDNNGKPIPLSERFQPSIKDPRYSMPIGADFMNQLWNDPTDPRPEIVNKPGFFQKARANFIDFFAEIEKVDKDLYDEYALVRNKKAARMEQLMRNFALPLRELIASSPWTPEAVSDMLAARHIKLDGVNKELAKRASDKFLKQLMKGNRLTPAQVKQLQKERMFVKSGKMPDGSDYVDANGNAAIMSSATKRELMFNLMERYAAKEAKNSNGNQEIRTEWEIFKDGAAGFSDGGAASAIVRKVDDILQDTDRDQALFDEIASVFDALNRTTLETLQEGGLITDSEVARLLADKSAYAPLRREAYNLDEAIEAIFKQGAGGGKQLSTRGGTSNLSEPVLVLQNALAKAEAAAAAAERNLANNYLYDTINQNRDSWKPWFFIIDKDKYATHDADGFLVERNSTAQNKSDIALIRSGKKLLIRPNMHNERAMGFVRAVNNMDAQRLNGPMQIMNWLNGIVRWVNVSASPVFLLMNAFKDPFTAAYNMQATAAAPYMKEIFTNGYPRAFRALHKVYVKGERNPLDPDVALVERFEAAGGRTSFIEALKEMDSTWRNFDGQIKRRQQHGFKEAMWFRDTALERIENLNIMIENVVRLAAFDVMTDTSGGKTAALSEKQAARLAQDLTTNFTRRGYYSQSLGVWWLFFNATVQGNYQVVRNLLGSRKLQAAVGGTVAFALLLDLMGRALYPDDWDEIPEWDKQRFIIAPFKVGGEFVRIPAPWVYNIFWRMGGMLGETSAGLRKPQDTVIDMATMSLTALSPISAGSITQAVAPTALDPFVQILENKDFAGNPLAPEGFPGANRKANAELFWNSTPKLYQDMAGWVNEATGGSPMESGALDLRPADYKVLANFLTGSLGRFMSDTAVGLSTAVSGEMDSFKDIPLMSEFFSEAYGPMRASKYHDNVSRVYGAHKLEQMYRSGPDRDLLKLHELRKERTRDLRMYKHAQDVERQLKSLRQRLRAAQGRGDKIREDQLRQQVEVVQDRFNESYSR